jgi:hypothetical protein
VVSRGHGGSNPPPGAKIAILLLNFCFRSAVSRKIIAAFMFCLFSLCLYFNSRFKFNEGKHFSGISGKFEESAENFFDLTLRLPCLCINIENRAISFWMKGRNWKYPGASARPNIKHNSFRFTLKKFCTRCKIPKEVMLI